VGVGVAILAPIIVPVLSNVGKPLAKSVIKSGILMYEKGRETFAELGEVFDDMVAEAKIELEGAGSTTAAAAPAGAAAAATTAVAVVEAEPVSAEPAAPQGNVS
jgi:hypothetical protein